MGHSRPVRHDHDGRFSPTRSASTPTAFATGTAACFDFVPQGGGDAAQTHRCPGEKIGIALTETALRLLTRDMTYTVPADQDLSVDLARMPALPASGFVIAEVSRRQPPTAA